MKLHFASDTQGGKTPFFLNSLFTIIFIFISPTDDIGEKGGDLHGEKHGDLRLSFQHFKV